MTRIHATIVAGLVAAACGSKETSGPVRETCTGYPDPASSPYVLPYPIGVEWRVSQGNCSGFGHSGFWKYSYDFDMPIGSTVTAARAGEVFVAVSDHPDTGPHDMTVPPNLVLVRHADGTVAVYSHLEHGGVRVVVGQHVSAGDTLAASGNSGYTGNMPHLHFSIHGCTSLPGFAADPQCPAVPIVFANPEPDPRGPLEVDHVYRAGAH